jgi:hypothetical protein
MCFFLTAISAQTFTAELNSRGSHVCRGFAAYGRSNSFVL